MSIARVFLFVLLTIGCGDVSSEPVVSTGGAGGESMQGDAGEGGGSATPTAGTGGSAGSLSAGGSGGSAQPSAGAGASDPSDGGEPPVATGGSGGEPSGEGGSAGEPPQCEPIEKEAVCGGRCDGMPNGCGGEHDCGNGCDACDGACGTDKLCVKMWFNDSETCRTPGDGNYCVKRQPKPTSPCYRFCDGKQDRCSGQYFNCAPMTDPTILIGCGTCSDDEGTWSCGEDI